MRLYSSAALVAALLFALLQAGPGGCTLGTVDATKALKLSVSIAKSEHAAQLKLTVTNTSKNVVTLRFNSGQRFDFLALEAETKRIFWRWSNGKPFTEALSKEDFNPGESKIFEADVPYVGLPPTQYEITGFIINQPRPSKAPEAVKLDLRDKKVAGPFQMYIVAEVFIDGGTTPATVSLKLLNGVHYKLANPPDAFYEGHGFPVEAWLNQQNETYTLVDYNWVMAPLSENLQLFMANYIIYTKRGGIADIYKGIKIYGNGSFIAHCCQRFEQVKTGWVGKLEPLMQFFTAHRVGDFKDQYGKPGASTYGIAEYLFIKNGSFQKQIYVYTDPNDPAPEGFEAIAQHLSQVTHLTEYPEY